MKKPKMPKGKKHVHEWIWRKGIYRITPPVWECVHCGEEVHEGDDE